MTTKPASATQTAKRSKLKLAIAADGIFKCPVTGIVVYNAKSDDPEDWEFDCSVKQLKALIEEYLPDLRMTPPSYRDAQHSRAYTSIELGIHAATQLLKLNGLHQRPLNWGNGISLADAMRLDKSDSESWADDVSCVNISLSFDKRLGRVVLILTDGQHRSLATAIAKGSFEEIQVALHYLKTRDANRSADPPLSYDEVIITQGDDTRIVSIEEWLALINTPCGTDGLPVDLTQRKSVSEILNDGKTGAESPHAYALEAQSWEVVPEPEYIGPTLAVIIGSHPRVYSRIDQNAKQRSGSDELATNPLTGNEIARLGMPFQLAGSVLMDVGKRGRYTQEKDDQGTEYTKPGSLKAGGRWAAPPKFPSWWLAGLGNFVARAWIAWDAAKEYHETSREVCARVKGETHYSDGQHPAWKAYRAATLAASPDGDGARIADQRCLTALALAASDPTATDDTLADMAFALRYGVVLTEYEDGSHDWEPDTAYTAARKYLKECARLKAPPHPDTLTGHIAVGWRATHEQTAGPQDRFPGLDAQGIPSSMTDKALGKVPGRRRGRPKGSKNK